MTTIKDAVEDLLNHRRLTVDEAVDRHFGPTFGQRTNGRWDDRDAFLARIVLLREAVDHATITVVDELVDADRYAERHVIELVKRDGERMVQEVYVFAERDPDGRFTRIEEATVMLEQTVTGPRKARKKHLSLSTQVLDAFRVFWLPDLGSNQGPTD